MKKTARYDRLKKQTEDLIKKCNDPIARMATISAILHHKIPYFFWTGFYLLKDGRLIVGPYQGPLACMELKKNTGVCWAAIQQQKTIIVPNVHDFPGHIACDSRSKSEIVIPVYNKSGNLMGVLDADSKDLASFDENDRVGLEAIVEQVYL